MDPRSLERAIRDLLAQPLSDADLRARLEQMAADEISFSGFTWLWGPELYRRNRVMFRPLILSRFSTIMMLPRWRVEAIQWKGEKGRLLDAWLAEVDRNDDCDLFRKLYEWKLSTRFGWKRRDQRSAEIAGELTRRFRVASTPAQRQLVLRKFDLWFELEEATACALYRVDRNAAGPYILRHLKNSFWSGEAMRKIYSELLAHADAQQDSDFRWKLYRRQVPLDQWMRDMLALASQVRDSGELVQELERRHPEGWSLNLADGFFQLVQRRGRDVFPYVMKHLRHVWGGWFTRGSYGKMADFARAQGWWDFWAALIRICSAAKEFNKEVRGLIEDTREPEAMKRRLLSLAGVSREWNWPGLGVATVHQLEEPVALLMYERFPDLLRGPFKKHVAQHAWGETYPRLLEKFIEAGDEDMVDFLASRLVTRSGRWGRTEKMIVHAERLADYYAGLKVDEGVFSRRAANVLGQVPAYSIWKYSELIRQNRLARLLFERSAESYLADARSMADLVEASEIHVMALAYRTLGLPDERARALAREHLPLLLGTLLRPMQRDTRALAFGALANATSTLAAARRVLDRARLAFNLPDKRYPKEKLLGLMAQVLHRWPELRESGEQPVVYEKVV